MVKYELIPQQLLYQGLVTEVNFFVPTLVDFETACLAHDTEYVRRLFALALYARMVRRSGFPLSEGRVDRDGYTVDGTSISAVYAREYGVSFSTACGTHH